MSGVLSSCEAVNEAFVRRFWEYIVEAGYEHKNKSTGKPQFYRFTNPQSGKYPSMIELFSRKPDIMSLPDNAVLSPLPVDDNISRLSAILLDDAYYELLTQGRIKVSGVTILDALYLIPFKAKAWIDLSGRKNLGENVDSKNIRKHKNDFFRLTMLLDKDQKPIKNLPEVVKTDMNEFIDKMENEVIDLKQLGIYDKPKEKIMDELRFIYDL